MNDTTELEAKLRAEAAKWTNTGQYGMRALFARAADALAAARTENERLRSENDLMTGLLQSARGEVADLGSFAQYAEEDTDA